MSVESLQDKKLIVSKAQDAVYLSQKRNTPCFLGFLNEHEAQVIRDSLYITDDCLFWGGYSDATRVIFGSGVSEYNDFPITALRFIYKKEYRLSHRDFLGSLMSLGIERSTIGDILVFDSYTVVFVKTELVDYIKQEVTKIGRVGVKIVDVDLTDFDYVVEFDELSITVSSLRIDVFVSAICCLSRDKSQQLIKSDLVTINHRIENSVSKTLNVGDVITVRKFGKFVFAEDNGLSKKGKHKVLVKHFR
ncbi:MAG: hypothetical protein IJ275_07560 [Ruminococcus sp.]|nr:hypothetical protein [Ruminococcus sp.]